MKLDNITFKDIKDYEGLYQISACGKIRSIKNSKLKKISTCVIYPVVGLTKNKKQKTIAMHRLIAENFVPNPYNLPVVNHKDGDKQNYAVENLEWVTQQGNSLHAIETGLIKHSKYYQFNTDRKKYPSTEATKKSGRSKQQRYRDRLKAAGFKRIEYWGTLQEHEKVREIFQECKRF